MNGRRGDVARRAQLDLESFGHRKQRGLGVVPLVVERETVPSQPILLEQLWNEGLVDDGAVDVASAEPVISRYRQRSDQRAAPWRGDDVEDGDVARPAAEVEHERPAGATTDERLSVRRHELVDEDRDWLVEKIARLEVKSSELGGTDGLGSLRRLERCRHGHHDAGCAFGDRRLGVQSAEDVAADLGRAAKSRRSLEVHLPQADVVLRLVEDRRLFLQVELGRRGSHPRRGVADDRPVVDDSDHRWN